jgi:hypothetical protein
MSEHSDENQQSDRKQSGFEIQRLRSHVCDDLLIPKKYKCQIALGSYQKKWDIKATNGTERYIIRIKTITDEKSENQELSWDEVIDLICCADSCGHVPLVIYYSVDNKKKEYSYEVCYAKSFNYAKCVL